MFCSQCGTQIDEADRFCAKCGKSTNAVSVAVQAQQASSTVRESVIEYLVAEFLRLEPLARQLFFRGLTVRAAKWALNPVGTVLDTLGIGADSRAEAYERKHAGSFSMQELAQIIRYASAYRLLTLAGRRPSKISVVDRAWNGDYFEVPGYVHIEYERRIKDPTNADFDFRANYFPEEAAVLRGSHAEI